MHKLYRFQTSYLHISRHILSHENEKDLGPFYQKSFWYKMNVIIPVGVLHSFSIKKNFYNKMNLKLYFNVTIQCTSLWITWGNFSITQWTKLVEQFSGVASIEEMYFKSVAYKEWTPLPCFHCNLIKRVLTPWYAFTTYRWLR